MSRKPEESDEREVGLRGWLRGKSSQAVSVRVRAEEAQRDRLKIAVLPFANISPDSNDEYFADGMTEELISTISKIRGLQVIARTSIMTYKGEKKKISEVARELEVGTILEGSVRKAGDKLRISAQLIDSRDSRHLWSETYDRELKDVFAIQSDVSHRVAEALRIELQVGEKKESTANTKAYTLYLKGRYLWNERTKEAVEKALTYFEGAINLDPMYAPAYAGLADCYAISPDYMWMRPKEAMPKAKEYALKAIELDRDLAEAHALLGLLYTAYDWRWDEAEKEFLTAIELKPSYATAYHWYSHLLRATGRSEEAYEKIKKASELDPMSKVIGVNLGEGLLLIGRLGEAIVQMNKVKEYYPDYADVRVYLAFAYYLDSRPEEAINELREAIEVSSGEPLYKALFAYLLGLIGRREEAIQIIEELKGISKSVHIDYGHLALALYAVGNIDEAFDCLEKAYEERSDSFLYIMTFPWYSKFRKDPRWRSFEKRLGIRKDLDV